MWVGLFTPRGCCRALLWPCGLRAGMTLSPHQKMVWRAALGGPENIVFH